ncbi:hypothetical protein PCA10_09650 [Metapseudomonas resinovorans NBRC 106553]|uniref:Uncharacterized protein n=2 Tax=Metapseudomonas resinovorans TaxID=53412 RepID=S6ACS9_METRE|nr:hypothetical protein PCA10_09650 [Pseudomonas resinovorans NBRC 106553]
MLLVAGALLAVQGVFVDSINPVMAASPGISVILAALVVAMFSGAGAAKKIDLTMAFALGLILGGVFNVVAGWGQWLELDLGPLFIGKGELSAGGVYGNIAQRNIFVSYLFITYFAFVYYFSGRSYALRVAPIYGVLVGATVALTGSRAAVVYVLVAVFLPVFLTGKSRRLWLWSGALLLLSNVVTQAYLYYQGGPLTGVERFVYGESFRLDEYRKAFSIFLANLPMGVGMQNYALSSFELGVLDQLPSATGDAWSHPHNLFLMLLAGCGLLGVALSVLIVWLMAYVLRRGGKDDSWAFGAGALACVFIHSQLEYPLWLFGYFVVFCVLLGIVVDEGGYVLTRWGSKVVTVLMSGVALLSVHAVYGYFVFVQNYASVDGAERNRERLHSVYTVSVNPLISQTADLVVLNYLVPSRENWKGGFCLFEGLARSVPSYTLLDQMGFYAWYAGDFGLASSVWRAREIYFPNRDWETVRGLFERYYPGQSDSWSDFLRLEKDGFNHVEPYFLSKSDVCRR